MGLLDRFVIYHVDAPGQVRVNMLLFQAGHLNFCLLEMTVSNVFTLSEKIFLSDVLVH